MRSAARRFIMMVGMVLLGSSAAWAVPPDVPGAADPGRIQQPSPLDSIAPRPSVALPATPEAAALVPPDGAENVTFALDRLNITGVTVFSDGEIAALSASYLHRKVSLADIYGIANVLANKYHAGGYFLTRVAVPDQRIANGVVTIAVTEGYIDQVILNNSVADYVATSGYISRIRDEKPLRAATLESALLGLNALPGQTFQAVLAASSSGGTGASQLTLSPHRVDVRGSVGFDNYGSRFLGPNEVNASVTASLLPLQETTLYGLASMPTRELGYVMLRHNIAMAPDLTIGAEVAVTRAHPGYTLTSADIGSTAINAGMNVSYQWIRQRQENFSTRLSLGGRNVMSNLSGTPLTREHVRALRASLSYDVSDVFHGANVANLTLSQGINGLGSSGKGDLNLSRSEAAPDFSKAELNLSRLQKLDDDWSALLQFSGQIASGALYSSEEFGYGGQSYGRAYDASEIVGDRGVEAGVELRYEGWRDLHPVNLQPYIFYDSGVVINYDNGQSARDIASSAGAGMRFATSGGQAGTVGLALPLTRDVLAPVYGAGHSSPRLMLQISQSF